MKTTIHDIDNCCGCSIETRNNARKFIWHINGYLMPVVKESPKDMIAFSWKRDNILNILVTIDKKFNISMCIKEKDRPTIYYDGYFQGYVIGDLLDRIIPN